MADKAQRWDSKVWWHHAHMLLELFDDLQNVGDNDQEQLPEDTLEKVFSKKR